MPSPAGKAVMWMLKVVLVLAASRHITARVLKRSAEGDLLDWARDFLRSTSSSGAADHSTTSRSSSASFADLTDDTCEAVMTQCALRDSPATRYYVLWRDAYATAELDRQRRQYDDSLRRLKVFVNTLVDSIIAKQAIQLPTDLCTTDSTEAEAEITPATSQTITSPTSVTSTLLTSIATTTTTTSAPPPTSTPMTQEPKTSTTATTLPPWSTTTTQSPAICTSTAGSVLTSADPSTSGASETFSTSTTTTSVPLTTTKATTVTTVSSVWEQCVSPWSQWSGIYGFGTQERTRRVLRDDIDCPEANTLLETRQVDNLRDSRGRFVFDDMTLVSGNFYHDFVQPTRGLPRDLLVIIDSSASIPDSEFEAVKNGLKVLIDVLCGSFGLGSNNNRMSIIQFSSESKQVHHFREPQSRDALLAAVDSMQHMRSSTCTGTALEMGYHAFDPLNGARSAGHVAHETLLITDGRSNCGPDIKEASLLLQSRSTVFALAIDLGYDLKAAKELQAIVSTESPRYLFSLANFQDFNEMVRMVQVSKTSSTCLELENTNDS